jgi:transcriptional regulator with XRE-family HTH domain
MAQRNQIVAELKRLLKERGKTYADVARKLKLSLASVKRLFSRADLSLERIDEICELIGLELSDVIERMRQRETPISKLTLEQERQIIADPKLLLMTWLALNKWRFEDIVKFYDFTERETERYLIKLDRMRIIELQPGNRMRLLESRGLSWRPGGPMQRFLSQSLLREFFASDFSDPRAEFCFYGAEMSEGVMMQVRKAIQSALNDCMELSKRDLGLPVTKREGAVCVLAMRPWRYSGFDPYRTRKIGP